jgi:hypothetical protein
VPRRGGALVVPLLLLIYHLNILNSFSYAVWLLILILPAQIRSSFAELLASVVQTLLKDPLEQRALLQSVRLIFYQKLCPHAWTVCEPAVWWVMAYLFGFGGWRRNTKWAT